MNDKQPGTQAGLFFPPTCRIMSASYDLQTTNADNADEGTSDAWPKLTQEW